MVRRATGKPSLTPSQRQARRRSRKRPIVGARCRRSGRDRWLRVGLGWSPTRRNLRRSRTAGRHNITYSDVPGIPGWPGQPGDGRKASSESKYTDCEMALGWRPELADARIKVHFAPQRVDRKITQAYVILFRCELQVLQCLIIFLESAARHRDVAGRNVTDWRAFLQDRHDFSRLLHFSKSRQANHLESERFRVSSR